MVLVRAVKNAERDILLHGGARQLLLGGESQILHGGVHGGDLVETLWPAKSGQKLTGRPILPSMATCHSF